MDGTEAQVESRMQRGWRLTGAAWGVMRRDPTMIALALVAAAFSLAGAAVILYFGGVFHPSTYSRAHFGVVALIGLYPLTLIAVFFNVALTAAAAADLRGERLTLGEALGEAWARRRRIALWALLSAGVGLLLSEIANRIPAGGRIAAWLLGAAWALATIFAIPLLTLEDANPLEAAQGSVHLVRSKWGEGLTGMVGINAWTGLVSLPALVVGIVGVVVLDSAPALGVVLIVCAAAALVTVSALSAATRQVFNLALFQYATTGGGGAFATADLQDAFFGQQPRQRRRTSRWAWVALGLIAVLFLAAVLFGHHRNSSGSGTAAAGSDPYWHVTLSSAVEGSVQPGMPVVYEGRTVGRVVSAVPGPTGVAVDFTVEPSIPYEETGKVEVNPDEPGGPVFRLDDAP